MICYCNSAETRSSIKGTQQGRHGNIMLGRVITEMLVASQECTGCHIGVLLLCAGECLARVWTAAASSGRRPHLPVQACRPRVTSVHGCP